MKILFVILILIGGAKNALARTPNVAPLAKRIMVLGTQKLTVKLAMTHDEQERGLMFCRHLSDKKGMLFVFSRERTLYFWMKNTLIPLSIGFFNKHKKLIDVQEMAVIKNPKEKNIPIYKSKGPALYALEVNKGWFARHHISVGSTFKLLKGKMRTKPVMLHSTRH